VSPSGSITCIVAFFVARFAKSLLYTVSGNKEYDKLIKNDFTENKMPQRYPKKWKTVYKLFQNPMPGNLTPLL
jgi:hypothetical protein